MSGWLDLSEVAYTGETEVPSRGTCDSCELEGRRKSAFARGGRFLGMLCEVCRSLARNRPRPTT